MGDMIFSEYYVRFFGERQDDGTPWTDDEISAATGVPLAKVVQWRDFAQKFYRSCLDRGVFPTDADVINEWLRFHPEDKPHTHIPTPFGLVDRPLVDETAPLDRNKPMTTMTIGQFLNALGK